MWNAIYQTVEHSQDRIQGALFQVLYPLQSGFLQIPCSIWSTWSRAFRPLTRDSLSSSLLAMPSSLYLAGKYILLSVGLWLQLRFCERDRGAVNQSHPTPPQAGTMQSATPKVRRALIIVVNTQINQIPNFTLKCHIFFILIWEH